MASADNDKLELIRKLQAAQVPHDRIMDLLDRYDAEGGVSEYEQHVAAQTGQTPYTNAEVSERIASEKQQFKQSGKAAAGAAIVAGTSMATAGLGAPLGLGAAGTLGLATAGSYGGELLRQQIFREKMSQRKARESALWTLIPGAGTQLYSHAAGSMSGVAPQFTQEVAKRTRTPLDLLRKGRGYRLTFGAPPADAELRLGERIGQEVRRQARPITAGRQLEQQYIDAETRAGTLIDPQPTIDALRDRMLKGQASLGTATGRNYNRRLEELALTLEQRKTTGGVTPDELDELISSVLDPSIYGGRRASGNLVARKGLPPARESAKEQLLGVLPDEARDARTAAARELFRRETAERYFSADKSGGAMVNQIRNLFKPGHEKALEALNGVSKQAGIDYVAMAKEIATARAFTNDVRMKSLILHRIMATFGIASAATGNWKYAAGAAMASPSVQRVGAKLAAPLQNIAGPVGAAIGGYTRSDNEPQKVAPGSEEQQDGIFKQTPVSPEQMFADWVNVERKQ